MIRKLASCIAPDSRVEVELILWACIIGGGVFAFLAFLVWL